MRLVLAIADDVDSRALGILRKLDNVQIVENSPQSVLISDEAVSPIRIKLVEAGEIGDRVRAEQAYRPGRLPRLQGRRVHHQG
jgi:hypothetical protein